MQSMDRRRRRFDSIAIGLGALALVLVGCTYEPAELAIQSGLRFTPDKFCSGDRISVSYIKVQDLEWTKLLRSDGGVLLTFTPGVHSLVTPPMRREWLPLRMQVKVKGHGAETGSLAGWLTNIDQETWVVYESARELREGDLTRVKVGEVEEFDTETQTRIQVSLYEVYADFVGFAWELPFEDFGPRARILRLRNPGARTMEFSASPWGRTYRLGPGQETEVLLPPAWPAGQIQGRYEPAERRLVGTQKGEYTKPENEHFEFFSSYVDEVRPLDLLLVCQDA